MKCPYCNKEMYHPVGKPTWSCQNWDCMESDGMIGNHVLWEELIRTRKALDVAVDALKDILSQANFTQMLDASRFHCIRTGCEFALAEISALEQKE